MKTRKHWTGKQMPKEGETWQHIYRGKVTLSRRIGNLTYLTNDGQLVSEGCLLRLLAFKG